MATVEKRNASDRGGASFRSSSKDVQGADTLRQQHEDDCGGAVVQRSMLFSGISAEGSALVSASAHAKEFNRGEMLCFEGDAVQRVFLLTSGFVKINKFGMSGTEVILKLAVPGDVIGAVDLFSVDTHCTTAQAFRSCRALVWDAVTFKGLVQRFPVLHQNMVRILSEYLLELENRFREVATERVGLRVAGQLLRLSEKMGRRVKGAVEIGLSREELAQMTGTTLFTVSRLLSAWEARGIVKPRREAVTICDVHSLRAISEDGQACATPPGTLCFSRAACRRPQRVREAERPRPVVPSGVLRHSDAAAAWASVLP